MTTVLVVAVWAGAARADHEIDAGLNFRTDNGTQQLRVELGARRGSFEAAVVLDPGIVVSSQTDHDGLAIWWFAPERFAAFAGWRNTSYNLIGDVVWHEKLLGGVLARLPSIGTDKLQFVIGLEIAADVVRHGSGITTEWFSVSSVRAVEDLVSFSLFGRAELALGR
jgi:hypothetical protein